MAAYVDWIMPGVMLRSGTLPRRGSNGRISPGAAIEGAPRTTPYSYPAFPASIAPLIDRAQSLASSLHLDHLLVAFRMGRCPSNCPSTPHRVRCAPQVRREIRIRREWDSNP